MISNHTLDLGKMQRGEAMREVGVPCSICGDTHRVQLDDERLQEGQVVVVACPSLDRRYRLMQFFIDSRRNFYDGAVGAKIAEQERAALEAQFGRDNFEEKFRRWKGIQYPTLGLIDEYPKKIEEIINTYSMGFIYPAVTSSCCLAERILNRLVLRCRSHFKAHPDFKRIYRNDSFDDWSLMLRLLKDWDVISGRAIELFAELMPIRHQTIHYNDGYSFEDVAPAVINKLIEAITEVFGVLNRRDIYLIFDVPGEIWVRSEAQALPFVQEFVLPHCYRAHAVHDVDFANRRIIERLGRLGKLTDAEFVELRNAQRQSSA